MHLEFYTFECQQKLRIHNTVKEKLLGRTRLLYDYTYNIALLQTSFCFQVYEIFC